MSMSIVCTGLRFAWPDGAVVFDGLNFAVGAGRTGLIGVNGTGKSTLLRLIAGELTPEHGSVHVAGELGYLPQNLTLAADRPVDDVLGIAPVRAALLAIERGDADEAHFAAVGDAWDVEERARATLARMGLTHIDLDRRVGELSGGESILLGLAAQFLRRPDVLLLDEPTNNLDLDARGRLYAAVESWPGVMIVVSHDRELLELVDQIADLSDGDVRWYGGNLSAYEEAVATEQEAAERTVRAAEADVRRQRRELIEARTKLDRRRRYGRKMEANKREPKIIMGARKRQAQVSAGKHRTMHMDRLTQARDRLTEADEAIRDDDEIRVDLPETRVPAGRTVLVCADTALQYGCAELRDDSAEPRPGDTALRHGGIVSLTVRGPERIALIGANGTGKTTLLRTIAGQLAPVSGTVTAHVPLRYLPQRLDLLDDTATIVDNVRAFAPAASDNAIRARLARFLFRGDSADQTVGTLSGGERFRATFAALLSASPAPQLLMLDEPTNDLDMASVRQLTEALAAYEGTLLVAGHDLPFLRSIGVTRWLRLESGLAEVDPM